MKILAVEVRVRHGTARGGKETWFWGIRMDGRWEASPVKTWSLTGVLCLGGKEHIMIEVAACVYAQHKEKFSSQLEIILGT